MASHGIRYTEGSVFSHISNLSITSAVGLFAIFIVDLVDVFFISLLGEKELAAAVGFAGIGLFFGAAVCIGVSIAISTVVAQEIGAARQASRPETGSGSDAARLASHGLLVSLMLTIPLCVLTLWFAPEILGLLGARDQTLAHAVHYFRIVGCSLPILGLAMASTSLLRAVGEARLSMWATIIGGLVNAVFDPLLIFGFSLDLTGAAIASVLSRCTVAAVGLYFIARRYGLLRRPERSRLPADVRQISTIAVPSLITNLAGPVASAYATSQMARFGTDAVAAAAVVGRITPVAFAGLYGLSGAVGPVASQNVGAQNWHRVRQTLISSAWFVWLYVLPVAIVLLLLRNQLVVWFSLEGEAAELLRFYCRWIVISYAVFGLQLAANPLFTALRHPGYATISNLLRDLCFGIPLVAFGSQWLGAEGVLAGQALASVMAGVLSFGFALWLTHRVETQQSIKAPIAPLTQRWHFHRAVVPGIQHRGH